MFAKQGGKISINILNRVISFVICNGRRRWYPHMNSRRSVTSQNNHTWKWIVSLYPIIHIWQIRDVTNRQLFTRRP